MASDRGRLNEYRAAKGLRLHSVKVPKRDSWLTPKMGRCCHLVWRGRIFKVSRRFTVLNRDKPPSKLGVWLSSQQAGECSLPTIDVVYRRYIL